MLQEKPVLFKEGYRSILEDPDWAWNTPVEEKYKRLLFLVDELTVVVEYAENSTAWGPATEIMLAEANEMLVAENIVPADMVYAK